MCPPVSPRRGASIIHSQRTMHVFLVWKRRCADVRAGTQAPPLPFQHMSPFRKGENRKFGACGASANSKTKNLMLAELPQIAKQKIWRLRSFRKGQNKKFGARSRTARFKIKNLVLAVQLQGSKEKNWCSQLNCKAQNKRFGARSSTASIRKKKITRNRTAVLKKINQ